MKSALAVLGFFFFMTAVFPAAAGDGYEGLIAPSSDANGADGAAPEYTPKDRPPEATLKPGLRPLPAPESSGDIKLMALVHGAAAGGGAEDAHSLPPEMVAGLARPGLRIKGMLPEEYAAARKIELLMGRLRNKNVSAAARKENIEKAYTELSSFAESMRSKKKIPNKVYRAMGLPEENIQEKKAAAGGALRRLDEALDELDAYRKQGDHE